MKNLGGWYTVNRINWKFWKTAPNLKPRKILYADPLHAGRHPFQTYLLTLCLISGIPLLIGRPAAKSVDELLPNWLAFAWGASLFFGAAIALIGSYWPVGGYANALTLERVGLLLTGSAAVIYSLLIFGYGGVSGGVSGLIVLGFGLSCLRRAHDIAHVIIRAIRTAHDQPNAKPLREDQ